MPLSARRAGRGLLALLASGLLAATALAALPAAQADELVADGDELTGTSSFLDLGAICPGESASGTVGFRLDRQGNGVGSVWANATTVTITAPTANAVNGTVTATAASGTTPATWVTSSTGNDDNGKTAPASSSTVTVAVPLGAAVGSESGSILTFSGRGTGARTATVTRTDNVLVLWSVAYGCTPPDTTPPVITYALDPASPAAGGWYGGDVAIDWTVTDPESPVTTTGCADTTWTEETDGDGHTFSCAASSAGGSAGPVQVTVRVDRTAPVVAPVVSGTVGDHGWYTSDVTVHWDVSDALSGLLDPAVCPDVLVDADQQDTTYSCSVTDNAGNTASGTTTVKRDATAPELTWTDGPEDGAVYDFGDPVPAASCTATDATSGVTADGCTVTGGGTAVGEHTLTATARDEAGNVVTSTRGYTVLAWTIDGFSRPVAMGAGAVNTAKAGSTVPLKFSVHKASGPAVTAGPVGTITMQKVGCATGAATGPVEEIASTGGTSLRYADGQWIQNWATPSSGKGSCYRVTLTTADGSVVAVTFQLK